LRTLDFWNLNGYGDWGQVSRIGQFGDVHHTKCSHPIPDTKLHHASADIWHGFGVIGRQTVLHLVELIPGFTLVVESFLVCAM
jgi:hypothetical protein